MTLLKYDILKDPSTITVADNGGKQIGLSQDYQRTKECLKRIILKEKFSHFQNNLLRWTCEIAEQNNLLILKFSKIISNIPSNTLNQCIILLILKQVNQK